MNGRQLAKLGIPEHAFGAAIQASQALAIKARSGGPAVNVTLAELVKDPAGFLDDPVVGQLAYDILHTPAGLRDEPIDYAIWGGDGIDQACHHQMQNACKLPIAVAAALMPDAHVGYGLPIGGVLATRGAVVPYAVGVDIGCRMKLSVMDMPVETMRSHADLYETALQKGTRFGVGATFKIRQEHEVMDRDWNVCKVTAEKKDRAWQQLGTSGSGNHFAEFGVLRLNERDDELGLDAGNYVALMSHSGSRGAGAAVCDTYSRVARAQLPKQYAAAERLAWLDLASEAGQEYWNAMNLMGEYSSANHDVIHRNVSKLLGAKIIVSIENHHNFAWKETHNGEEVIVHRKGATPAGKGVLGVIPGSMADPAYVVRGRGNVASLASASHGAGRAMSRTAAKSKYTWKAIQKDLAAKGVRVLSAAADEVPGCYKDIREVMANQVDLVDIVGSFAPKLVLMCGDGSKPED